MILFIFCKRSGSNGSSLCDRSFANASFSRAWRQTFSLWAASCAYMFTRARDVDGDGDDDHHGGGDDVGVVVDDDDVDDDDE